MQPLPALAAVAGLALLVGWAVRRWLVVLAEVEADSMVPTLRPGRRVLVRRHGVARRLRRGDVVVAHSAELGRPVVKRVIGLPGERVEVAAGGRVVVEGHALEEPYVLHRGGPGRSLRVPAGHVMLLGDNRARSSDARTWRNPFVPVSAILGRVGVPPRGAHGAS
ncbi:signal peptidase I [Citricoccus sp. SGAir0253]|uniref:signal peptidase I n=1 Tax=Citricoccus sp. SGAir0253 TaxID=2567881 RepID=UPI0010CCFAE5|nr:signal peptidase I [Citricoccus sp. SGAir0253]QCU76945.1 signal peptidase I [Citricoccus sp. SGAir0253]